MFKRFIQLLVIVFLSFMSAKESINESSLFKQFQSHLFEGVCYAEKRANNSKYFIVSPLSIFQVLSLVSNGAMKSTQQAMVSSLGANTVIELNKENVELYNKLKDSNSNLIISNGVFTRKAPKKGFIDIATQKYHITVQQLNSVEQVNQWSAEQTNNKITKIVDSIENSVMMLVNVVYFKGNWKFPFNSCYTTQEYFNGNYQIDMMHKVFDSITFYEDEFAQLIELPYSNPRYNALIVLPRPAYSDNLFFISVALLEKYISINSSEMKQEKVSLSLPKVEFASELLLNDIIKTMGMRETFTPIKANFDNLSEDENMFISLIKQKTILKIDEIGTEASSTSNVGVSEGCQSPNEQNAIQMKVERPFYFIIRDKNMDNIPIMIAKIEDIY